MTNPSDKPIVLLIDDSPMIHRLLTYKLKNEGLEFLTAFSGEEGIELARDNLPSLVLVDLDMPGMNGHDVVRELKSDPKTMHIPTIVISGSTESSDKVLAFELGAMDFVTKPIDLPELRARIGSALHIHRLMQLLEQRAQIDGLTALKNRAYFDERITSTYNSLSRTGHTASLVMCDLDHFKKLNDTFGHQAGDAVLVGFSEIVTTTLRSCDVACRYGGEEFALILPDTDAEGAMVVCDRIRQHTQEKNWPAYPELNATVSLGIANIPIHDTASAAEWIQNADQALYAAKEAGRNRVVIYEPEGGPQELRPAS